MKQQTNSSRELMTGLVAVIVTLGAFDTFQQDLQSVAGYPISIVCGVVISGIIVFVVCLVAKMAIAKALAISLVLPPTLGTFELIRKHSVGSTGSGVLSLILAVVLAALVGVAISALVFRKL
jgi:hypothetical protein